jgi:hypothetical protein
MAVFLSVFQIIARASVLIASVHDVPASMSPAIPSMPFAEIVLYAFESEKKAALSGALSLLFVVGTIANILWSLYFFGHRWPALALFVGVIDVISNIFSFGFAVAGIGSNWVGWVFYIYSTLYVLMQALVIWPISLTALRSDGAWGGKLLMKEDDGIVYMPSLARRTAQGENCTCLLEGVFVCTTIFAALLVGIFGAVTSAAPIVFTVTAAVTVGVVALLLGVSTSMSMSSEDSAFPSKLVALQHDNGGAENKTAAIEPLANKKQANLHSDFTGHHPDPT